MNGESTGAIGVDALTRVTLLLCVRLLPSDAPKPLSLSEYYRLLAWVDAKGIPLGNLLSLDGRKQLAYYPDADRIQSLLRRSADVDMVLGHWQELGIWVLGEQDPRFPQRLRKRLRSACLPLLFGAGSVEILNQGGLCVVGSRDCAEDALEFAQVIGNRAGHENMVVISSDMRGVDRQVLASTLNSGGRAVCILSDSLEKAVGSRRYRDALDTGRGCLITPFTPDTHFAVANAMRTNRYQYGLSDAAIVVEARQTGGIWSGAEENRKHRWVPAFVRCGPEVSNGNSALLHLGLLPITREDLDGCHSLTDLLVDLVQKPRRPGFDVGERDRSSKSLGETMFTMFVDELRRMDPEMWRLEQAIAAMYGLEVQQVHTWIRRAQSEGLLETSAEYCAGEPE